MSGMFLEQRLISSKDILSIEYATMSQYCEKDDKIDPFLVSRVH